MLQDTPQWPAGQSHWPHSVKQWFGSFFSWEVAVCQHTYRQYYRQEKAQSQYLDWSLHWKHRKSQTTPTTNPQLSKPSNIWTKKLWTFRNHIFSSLPQHQMATCALGRNWGRGQEQHTLHRGISILDLLGFSAKLNLLFLFAFLLRTFHALNSFCRWHSTLIHC